MTSEPEALTPPRAGAPADLWIDAGAGIAGDMLLGALVDAGAPLEDVQRDIDAVIPDTVRLSACQVRRAGLRAIRVEVRRIAEDLPHRRWPDIRELLQAADLAPLTRTRALETFRRLAVAEATAHGVDVEAVHFHEVGSWDSIADVVGTCAALSRLGVATVSGSAAALGSGTTRTAHGLMSVPVPAVLELARGWRVLAGGEGELATPTGMALLTALAQRCEDIPALLVSAVGVGAGSRDPAGRANVVRVVLGVPDAANRPGDGAARAGFATAPEARGAVLVEANVDDLDPRVWPGVLASLLAAGASDAWLVPILMKKGRPGHTLSVLTPPERVTSLRDAIFSLVPTIGLREYPVLKTALHRTWREVEVDGGRVRIKVAHGNDVIVTATPEFDDVARLAGETGRPVRVVLDAAVAASYAAGLVPGAPAPGTLPPVATTSV